MTAFWAHFLQILKPMGFAMLISLFLLGAFFLQRFIKLVYEKGYRKCVFYFKVKRLPTVRIAEGSCAMEASTCVICLENFKDRELCKLLPACDHVFHITCIDAWLQKQLTCPLCRTSVMKLRDSCDLVV